MSQRTCSVDGCDSPHRARGLCRHHYKLAHERHDATCVTCGAEFKAFRETGKYCSAKCKSVHYAATITPPRTSPSRCYLPPDHPVIVAIRERRVAIDAERLRMAEQRRLAGLAAWRTPRECRGCAALFSPLYTDNMLDCSRRCSRKVHKRARRARERGATGSWVWSDFMRIAAKFAYCCAYCGAKPDRLDPDHVVPLAHGGYDSAANLLPACAACNSSKSAMTLSEWAAWREQRGLPPRVTNWAPEDRRYHHLTQVLLLSA